MPGIEGRVVGAIQVGETKKRLSLLPEKNENTT
jgi:hypothetical protein